MKKFYGYGTGVGKIGVVMEKNSDSKVICELHFEEK